MVYYIDSKYNNIMLQYYIKENFVKQIKEIQAFIKKKLYKTSVISFKKKGVFISINRGIIRDNIQKQVINTEEEHKQTL